MITLYVEKSENKKNFLYRSIKGNWSLTDDIYEASCFLTEEKALDTLKRVPMPLTIADKAEFQLVDTQNILWEELMGGAGPIHTSILGGLGYKLISNNVSETQTNGKKCYQLIEVYKNLTVSVGLRINMHAPYLSKVIVIRRRSYPTDSQADYNTGFYTLYKGAYFFNKSKRSFVNPLMGALGMNVDMCSKSEMDAMVKAMQVPNNDLEYLIKSLNHFKAN